MKEQNTKIDNFNERYTLMISNFQDVNEINELQKDYYEIIANDKVYNTKTFQIKADISFEEFNSMLSDSLFSDKSFKIVCYGMSKFNDSFNYHFVNDVEYSEIIRNINFDIYNNVILKYIDSLSKNVFEMFIVILTAEKCDDNDEIIEFYDINLK